MERKRKLEVDDGPSKKVEMSNDAYTDPTGGVNPYTGKPYSKRYYDILQKRTGKATWAAGVPCTLYLPGLRHSTWLSSCTCACPSARAVDVWRVACLVQVFCCSTLLHYFLEHT